MALVKEYFELTSKYILEYGENTILLMQVGSFFEVYGYFNKETQIMNGSKIQEFSQICELNVVEKNICVGKSNVMMAGFKDTQIEKYIKKIQDSGFTAVVYTQDEAMKNTSRSLLGIFSPGTYFQNESTRLSNSISCVWIDLIENNILSKGSFIDIGMANMDIFTGKTNIFQYKEIYLKNPSTYDELERFISIYNPSEIIIITNIASENELVNIISYAGITSNLIHKIIIPNEEENSIKKKRIKNCEKQIYQKEILSKFYKIDNFDLFFQPFYENNIATQAFCFLLDFIFQHNPHLIHNISEPEFENCSTRLSLANHSLKQLNIINDGNVKPSKFSCISHFLNECLTPMGKRQFLNNILNPTSDSSYLQREYNITEYFLTIFDEYQPILKQSLSTIKDISKWERQIFLKKISPESIVKLYYNLECIKNLYEKIIKDDKIIEYLNYMEKNILKIGDFCLEIMNFINNNINISIAKDIDQLQNFEINFFYEGVDIDLDKKSECLKDSELKLFSISEYLSNLIESKEKKNSKTKDLIKIHETEKNNFSLLTTSRRSKLLIDALPNESINVSIIYDKVKKLNFEFTVSKKQFNFEKHTSSNHCIIDEQINKLCKNISSSKVLLKDIITLVYNKFIIKLEDFQNKLESIINFITMIDLLYTKSFLAKKYNYCKPKIENSEKSFVRAQKLRHCLIENFQSNEIYVTNDIILGDGKIDGILLYGTNAVGKTTIIRALGIAVIMAQAGLYVPCEEFEFMPYKYIFTRIIGNDNIFKGLSTFAVEMSELRTILRLGDKNSLILGDELCSGTEIQSAISIFVSGIQHLNKKNCSFIFATHLHEIAEYEEIKELKNVKLKHMSVLFDKEKDLLVYDRKLKDGPGNNMYGLEVCKSLMLPNEFIENAYEIRMKYNPESKSILSLQTSSYNAKKIISLCEKCGINLGTEIHHLQHQSNADLNGIINNETGIFHKNNLANLMTLCNSCHNAEHKNNKKGSKRIKTTKGTLIENL